MKHYKKMLKPLMMRDIDTDTIADYLDILQDYFIENQPPCFKHSLFCSIETSEKRHFESSLACAY